MFRAIDKSNHATYKIYCHGLNLQFETRRTNVVNVVVNRKFLTRCFKVFSSNFLEGTSVKINAVGNICIEDDHEIITHADYLSVHRP